MTGTGFRKLALGSCVVLAVMAGQTMLVSPSFSMNLPGMSSSGGFNLPGLSQGGNTGGNVMNMLGGLNQQQLGQMGQTLSTSPQTMATPTDFTQVLQNLQTSGASSGAGSNILNGLMAGTMTPDMAKALSSVQNLGNLTGQQGAQQLMGNQNIQNLMQQLGGNANGANAMTQILSTAMSGGNTGNGLMNSLGAAGMQAVAQQVMQSNPALGNVFNQMGSGGGGAAGVANGMQAGMQAAAGGNPVQAITQIVQSLMSGAGGGGSSSGGGGGVNTEGEKYELENKECPPYGSSGCPQGSTACACAKQKQEIVKHHNEIRNHTSTEFQKHRKWIIETYWLEHILPALMLMAEQLSVAGIQQIEMIGTLLDAKHQLETQRLMQQLTAQAHKDYQPSEGMCTFGTTVRSLANSERKSDLVQIGVASRMMQRQTLSGDVLSKHGSDSDMRSRVKKFIEDYCDKADNANGLETLCQNTQSEPARRNIDIDYTRNIESRLTLEADFTPPEQIAGVGSAVNGAMQGDATKDEEDLFALAANLYSHNVTKPLKPEQLADSNNRVRLGGAELYLDLRSIFAKRSVAQNSFAAITSMRSEGDDQSAPYTKALMKELGITETAEIEKFLGKKPSYFAQMEVLTKKLYQNPVFYTELYDKPVNVERKGAALQAISLMQDRDLYNSLLRSEAVLSVLLETMLMKEQEKVVNEYAKINPRGTQ